MNDAEYENIKKIKAPIGDENWVFCFNIQRDPIFIKKIKAPIGDENIRKAGAKENEYKLRK